MPEFTSENRTVSLYVGHLCLNLFRTAEGDVVIEIDDPTPGTPAAVRVLEAPIWADLVAALAEETSSPLGGSLQPTTAPPVQLEGL